MQIPPAIKRRIRQWLPRSPAEHRIWGGPLKGAAIVTSWRNYPAAILGYAEPALTNWLLGQPRPGETWLDVGAHYGYTSLALCRAVGPAGRVFAFEPNLASAGCIAQTRLANRFWHWTVCPFGLDNSTGLTVQELPSHRGMIDSQMAATDADATERFLSTRFDAVWPTLCGGLPEVHGIKIDVQGMELEVLAGLQETLARARPKIVLEVHEGVSRARLLELLRPLQYTGRPVPLDPGAAEFDDERGNFSYVFLPGPGS